MAKHSTRAFTTQPGRQELGSAHCWCSVAQFLLLPRQPSSSKETETVWARRSIELMVSLKPSNCINTANKTSGSVQLCCHQGHPSLLLAVCRVGATAWRAPWRCCWHPPGAPLQKQQPSAPAPLQKLVGRTWLSTSTEPCPLWEGSVGPSVTQRGPVPPSEPSCTQQKLQLQEHRAPAHTLGIITGTDSKGTKLSQPLPAGQLPSTNHSRHWCSSW